MEADKKKAIIIGLGAIAILGGLLLTALVVFRSDKQELIAPITGEDQSAVILAPLLTWEDPAGFSFDYPGDLDTDSHEEDDENYAHLELTAEDHPGGIIVWMQDTTYKDIKDWAEDDQVLGGQLFDIILDGREAKKAVLADGGALTAVLDQEVIVLIEMMPGDVRFWPLVYDEIIKSFEFIPLASAQPKAPAASAGTDSGGEIWEEEEVVE